MSGASVRLRSFLSPCSRARSSWRSRARLRRPPAKPVFVDGQAQIVPAFQDAAQWIRQTLWVETEFDSDGDGKRDRMHVDVTRPRQTETEGLKVPVIYESSPYFAGTSGDRAVPLEREAGTGRAAAAAHVAAADRVQADARERLELAGRHVGAARVCGGALRRAGHRTFAGVRRRSACDPEQLAPKAVIDWLNGRAKGFTTLDGSEEVVATAVVHRQGRHDRHVVQRHDPARRGRHRRRGTRGDHSDRAEHVLLPLLPIERPRPASRRLARRRHRLPLRLRQQRQSGAARRTATRRIATASSPSGRDRVHRRLQRVLGRRAICCRRSRTSRPRC